MIDGHYTEDEWMMIMAACPLAAASNFDEARRDLEQAINRYVSQRRVKLEMYQAASERDRWSTIRDTADNLAKLIEGARSWLSPIWWADDGIDDPPARSAAIASLREISTHADATAADFGHYARSFSGKRNPDLDALYRAVLTVWTDRLHGKLRWSLSGGPMGRFFRTALAPVLGDRTPAITSVRSIMEKVTKGKRDRSGKRKRSKSRVPARTRLAAERARPGEPA